MKRSRFLPLANSIAAALTLTLTARAATDTWVGGTSVNWNDLNWTGGNNPPLSGDLLAFGVAGLTGPVLNNDFASLFTFNGLAFNSGASAYTFGGNAITLAGNVTNSSTSLQTINFDIALPVQRTFTTVTGGGNLSFGGVLSGAGGFATAGVGKVFLTNPANTTNGELIFGNGAANVASTVVNVASLSDYGVPSSIGARTAAQENGTPNGISLHFRGGTLQYTGSTPQSTNREIRMLNGTTGAVLDASGTDPSATLSFTHTGANINLFDTGGSRTLVLTGTNTGANTFAIKLEDQGSTTNATSINKSGPGTWFVTSDISTNTGLTQFSGGILNVSSISDYGVPSAIGARTAAQETAAGNGIGLWWGPGLTTGTLQYTGSTPQSTNRQIRVGTGGAIIDASGSLPTATLSFTHTGANINLFDTGGLRTITLTGTNTGNNSFAIRLDNQATNQTSLRKTGTGTWVIPNSDNTYTGETIIANGILNVASVSNYGVGSSIGPRALTDENTGLTGVSLHFLGGTLQYTGSTAQSTNRNIRILNGNGATLDASGSNPAATLSFTHTGANINFFDTPGTRTLTLTGTNTGNNGFSIQLLDQAGSPTSLAKSGTGTWLLNGPDANVNTGSTTVNNGILALGKSGVVAVNGPLILGDGTLQGVALIDSTGTGGNQIADGTIVSFNGSDTTNSGILRLNNRTETVGGLNSNSTGGIVENKAGAVGTGTLTVNVTGTQVYAGTLRDGDGVGVDGQLAFTKIGVGTQVLTGVSTHTGATTVTNGTLQVDGSLAAGSTVSVSNTGVLSGTGTVNGNVLISNGGTVASFGVFNGAVSVGVGGILGGGGLYNGTVSTVSGARIAPGTATSAGVLNFTSLSLVTGAFIDLEFGVSNDVININNAGGLALNGGSVNLFNLGDGTPLTTNGTYMLLDYTTSYTGALSNLSIANAQAGKFYTLADDTTNTVILLTIGDATVSEWTGGAANGLWTTPGNWDVGTPNSAGAVAKFGTIPTSPTTVAVNGPKTVGGIIFDNANGYTLTGGATDTITLNNGIAAAGITVNSGNHTIAAPVVLATDALTSTANGTLLTISGNISGAKALTASGTGITVLSGTNSYGVTNVTGGTLQIGDGGTAGTLGTGAVNVATGGTLVFNRSDDFTVAINILGAGAQVTKLGAGTLTLTGNNTFATAGGSGFNINEGTIQLGSATAVPSGVVLAFNGGTLDLNQHDVTASFLTGTSGSITDNGAGNGTTNLTLNQATDTTFGGSITDGPGRSIAVNKLGNGTLTLTGSNSFTGTLAIKGGAVIAAGTGGNIPIVSNVTLGDGSGSVWLIAGDPSQQFGAGTVITFNNAAKDAKFMTRSSAQTVAGLDSNTDFTTSLSIIQNDEAGSPGYTGALGTGTLTIDTAGTHSFTGLIRNQNGVLNLVKEGTGTQEIKNVLVQTDNFGTITINHGKFVINFTPNANGTNVINAATSVSIDTNGTFGLDGNWTMNGFISGTGKVVKDGTGSVRLNADSTFLGGFFLNSGTIELGSNAPLGDTGIPITINGGIIRAAGAARQLSYDVIVNNSFTIGRLTDLNGNLTLNADATITANNFDGPANGNSTLGPIGGNFRVSFAEGPQLIGTGAIVVNGVNTNTGGSTVLSGRVTVNSGAALSNAPLTVNSGILNLNNALQSVTSFSGTGGTVNLGAGTVLSTTQSVDTAFPGLIAGAGSLIKDGPGKLTLTGANSYTAGTTINGGTLAVNADSGLGNGAGALAIANGATLQAGATFTTNRALTLGTGGGTIDTNGNSVTLGAAGIVSGTTLTKTGNGTLTLSGTQSYSTLTAGAGTTVLNTALGTGTSVLNANAAVSLNARQTLGALNIGTDGLVTMAVHAPGAANVIPLTTNTLAIAANGKLDLTNNAMVVRTGNEATITALVASGFNGGLWNGPGINSSTAAADPNFRTGVAVVNNADLGYTDFAGVTGLTGNEILLKYTYFGDSDLTGTVTSDDFGLFLDGYDGVTPAKWVNGDYDYSGTVTSDDFGLFLESFNNQGGALRDPGLAAQLDSFAQQIGAGNSSGSALGGASGSSDPGSAGTVAAGQAAVPEPASMGLLAVGALGLLSRRRTQRRP